MGINQEAILKQQGRMLKMWVHINPASVRLPEGTQASSSHLGLATHLIVSDNTSLPFDWDAWTHLEWLLWAEDDEIKEK